ncbi:unnamed protein product [Gadus morhua 'NCC']
MVLPRRPGWEVLLLFWGSWGCWASPVPLIPCPEPCVCLDHTLINCSSSGLPHAPQHPSMDRTADLDLSHNLLSSVALRRPNPELLALRLGNNQISYLSLCLNEWSSDRVGRRMPSPGAWRSQRCVSWAPGLLLLSMERNRLAESPRGLGGSRALQVLQLSYNQISTLEAGDLEGLHQLKELHLQHNLISSLHPRAFVGLTNLTVVDFSFNLLTSLSPATFWSLRLGLVVRGGGNPWRCDCEMANLKRRMALDEDEDQRLWLDMVCHSPSSLAGRDLLQLHEEDFGCGGAKNKPGLHQDLTVDHGSTVLLPCSMQKGSTWWTPKGQVSANESQAGLLMSDITERDAGLYICLSQSHKDIVSVYNLKIRKQARANSRLPRSLPVDTQGIGRAGQVRAMTENQRLGLAVGLSIFFTFLVAFILGVFARPCIDVLCQKVCVKKNAPAQPGSVSSAGQSPYDNQAYSDEEDEPEIVSDRERRVTFSTQENQEESMNYKVTWASGQPKNQSSSSDEEQGNSTRTKMKSLKASSSQPVDSELGERGRLSSSSDEEQGNSTRTRKKSLKASSSQPVDSELGERGSLSSSSDEEEGNSTRTKKKSSIASPSQPVDNCINQKETDLEFTSEPFADWSPHLNDAKLRDQYQPNDSGDAFDFPESIQSGSASSESEEENTKIENAYQPHLCLGTVNPSKDFEIYAQENTWPELDLNNITGVKRHLDIKVVTETTGPAVPLNDTDQDYRYHANPLPVIKESTDFTSSSSESEDEPNMHLDTVSQINDFEINAQEDRWPELKLGNVNRVKRRLDIKATTDTTDPAVLLKDTDQDYRWSQLDLGNINQVKQPVNIKASTDSTSSSDSDEEPTDVRMRIENTSPLIEHLGTVSQKKESEMNVQNENWPVLDLIHVTRVKRRLDIKVATENTGPAVTLRDTDQDYRYNAKPHPDFTASTASTSSSSESEEEPNMHLDTVSQIKDFEINAQEERWPELKLGNVNRVKRRLDIKATTDTTDPAVLLKDTNQDYRWSQLDLGNINQVKQPVNIKASTDSTSSSDSDEEPTGVRTKIENTSPLIAHLGTVSQKKGSEMNVQNENWPVLDLSHVTRVKRRLDIKVATENTGPAVTLRDTDQDYRYNAKPHPDFTASTASTSSSSESEEEPNMHLDTVSQIKDFEINAQEERWPELKLGNVNRVKRRLDIKATTETTDPAVLLKDTAQDFRWSQLDLGNINQVKQPVNIKASTDSTSSSDSDEEPTDVRTRIANTSTLIEHLGTVSQKKESEMNVQNENWPVLDLIHVTRVKRRLDIKVATENTGPAVTLRDTDQDYRYNVKPHPDYTASTASTSSSSDSEEEIMGPVVNLEDTYVKTKVENAYQPHLHVGTASSIKDLEIGARDDGWPELDLGNVNRVKRRLDIKATTETGNPAVTLRDTDQDYRFHVKPRPESTESTDSTSSSSESEEATPGLLVNLDDSYVKTKVETAYQPHLQLGTIKDSEINAQEERWPKLNLSNISGIKQRLDIKVKPHPEIKESTDFTSSSSESEEDFTVVNLDNAYVKTKVENAYQPKLHLDKVNPIKDIEINAQEDRWPELDLGNVNRVKRRLDIKATTETTDPAVLLKDTDQDYRWSQLDLGNINQVKQPVHIKASTDSTSRSDSDEEPTDVRMKIAKFSTPIVHLGTVDPNKESEMNVQKGNWPLVDLIRVKRRLDIRVGTETTGPTLILEDTDQDYSNDSDGEMKVQMVKEEREDPVVGTMNGLDDNNKGLKSIPGPEYTPDLESRWAGLNLGKSRLRQRLDISANKAAPLKVSSETEIRSSSGERVDKIKEWAEKSSSVKDSDIDAQKETWPLVDLGNVTGVKRRLDIKVATPSPTSSSGDSGEANSWPVLDLDNISGIKRRLDIKTTPSSNISIEDWNTRLESPPPVPDSSTSNESENASMRHRRVDFPEYHTHGPARSFAQSVRGTSDTEVDSSFTTVDIKGWRSVKMGTQERRGLGALRAMSSERKRWDTDDKELGAEGSSQQSSHQENPNPPPRRPGRVLEPSAVDLLTLSVSATLQVNIGPEASWAQEDDQMSPRKT